MFLYESYKFEFNHVDASQRLMAPGSGTKMLDLGQFIKHIIGPANAKTWISNFGTGLFNVELTFNFANELRKSNIPKIDKSLLLKESNGGTNWHSDSWGEVWERTTTEVVQVRMI